MTRPRVIGVPGVKVDTRWVAEWHELTGNTPCYKTIKKAVNEYKSRKKRSSGN